MKKLFAVAALLPSLAFAATSGMANDLETKLLNHIFRTTAYTQLTNVYVGIGTGTAPTGDDLTLSSEVTATSTTGYQRVAVARADAQWNAPAANTTDAAGKKITNVNAITFPSPALNWCSGATLCTWFFVADAQCTSATVCGNGNILVWGQLTASKNINAGDAAPSFASTALSIALASAEDYLNWRDLVAAFPSLNDIGVTLTGEALAMADFDRLMAVN